MTVNEIINRLEELNPKAKLRCFDQFGNMYTSNFEVDSWRGAYNMPAIVLQPVVNIAECINPKEPISNLKECQGMEVTGWKGGEFTLNADDTLFLVGDWGTSGDSVGITEIYDDGYIVIESNMY
jgi:hypothetical protein